MSAAVMEIKMSATQSCRVNEERHKQSPVQRVNTSMPVYCHVPRAVFFSTGMNLQNPGKLLINKGGI